MKNIISFCLYGSHATYVLGMKENILLGKKYFPTWEIRIYYNDTVPENFIEEYFDLGAICIKCENLGKNKMNWEGMLWRFLPLDDNDVHHWISRDADSRLSKREADIVNQWIQSGKTLHCIRDHKCHYHAIMGGMFGINNKSFHAKYTFKKISDVIPDLYKYYKERPYNVDQEFLNGKFWNLLKGDVMAHISNKGRRIYDSDIEIPSVPDFIGKQYRLNNTIATKKSNITLLDLDNKIFKIKNQYNNYCLDIENEKSGKGVRGLPSEKVKLKLISDSNSQLWTMDNKHRIIHYNSNKFLDYDNSNNLIISTNGKNTWSVQAGGFIQNNINNMAIDMKGGLKDKRCEVWLYNINYKVRQQQWEIHIESDAKQRELQKESESQQDESKKSKITCVSGYWNVKNKHDNKYKIWFKNSMKIDCPYVFFGNKESIEFVKKYRNELPTYYIELNLEDFITYKYRENMITDSRHCPSVELNLIWNEKIFLLQKALKINPFSSDFFMWIDAGICQYRNKQPPSIPFPNTDKLNKLPKDKFIYSSGHHRIFKDKQFVKGNYNKYHYICGTSYIIHKNIINKFCDLYKKYCKLIDKTDLWTDQVLLTLIYRDNKELFYNYSHGYGTVCTSLF